MPSWFTVCRGSVESLSVKMSQALKSDTTKSSMLSDASAAFLSILVAIALSCVELVSDFMPVI